MKIKDLDKKYPMLDHKLETKGDVNNCVVGK